MKLNKKLVKIKVPIFTEEYSCTIVISNDKRLVDFVSSIVPNTKESIKDDIINSRGTAWNLLSHDMQPIICINARLSLYESIPTLAHEAYHIATYISNHIGINDGEFIAHVISAITRAYMRHFKLIAT